MGFRSAVLELQKRLANLVPPCRVRIVRLGNTVRFVSKPEIQERLVNLVPPRRVRIVRLGNTVRFVSKPESQERLANLVPPRRVITPKTTCKTRSAPQG